MPQAFNISHYTVLTVLAWPDSAYF